MTKEVTIGARTFQVRKLPAYPDQILMVKAFTPVLSDILPIISKMLADGELLEAFKNKEAPLDGEKLIELMEAAFAALGKISDEDLLALVARSLKAVQIKEGDAGWAAVMAPNGGMMYELQLPEILQLTWTAVEVNLMGFISAARGTSPGGAVAG